MWTALNFGKHAGRTLPQVVLSDPNWFFWAIRKGVFNGRLATEAAVLAQRATHIRIPKPDHKHWEVVYRRDREGRFLGFDLVKAKNAFHSPLISRLPHLNLAYIRQGNIHDIRDCRQLIRNFRYHYFGKSKNMTKQRCEAFFDNDQNFTSSGRGSILS